MQPLRIVMLGAMGAGKTTLARQMSTLYKLTHIEPDALYWLPGWRRVSNETMRERIRAAMQTTCWVIDSDFDCFRDLTWSAANTVVWLDYNYAIVHKRLVQRTLQRWITRETLHGVGPEPLYQMRRLLAARTISQRYIKRRKEYETWLSSVAYKHLHVVRLRHPGEAHTVAKHLSQQVASV
jgi:adenylate kinase family enzyme